MRPRLTVALPLACITPFVLLALARGPAVAAEAPSTDLPKTPAAKAPEAAPVAASSVTPAAKAPAGRLIAQLTYPVSTSASATELLQAADDYAFCQDWPHYREYLRQVVTSYGGTKEGGRALALLLSEALIAEEAAEAETIAGQLQEYTDPEIQAFVVLLRAAAPSVKAGQQEAVAPAYAAYAEKWQGTATGGWAALQLGDCYRYDKGDFAGAIAVYQDLLAQQPPGPIAEEALLALAQSLNWAGRLAEAKQAYEQTFTATRSPGLQLRALVGYSEVLGQTHDGELALQAVSEVISAYPSHPCAGFAYAQRSILEEKRGDWDAAVADVKAFLTYPPAGTYNQARGHLLLAKDAYRKGRSAEAAAEYAAVAQLAEADAHRTGTSDLGGPAYGGLAAMALDRGDLPEGLRLLRKAAGVASLARQKQVYLFQAADVAHRLGDTEGRREAVATMATELPGLHLTTTLVGSELLPAREP